jgi:hypothetical protein
MSNIKMFPDGHASRLAVRAKQNSGRQIEEHRQLEQRQIEKRQFDLDSCGIVLDFHPADAGFGLPVADVRGN